MRQLLLLLAFLAAHVLHGQKFVVSELADIPEMRTMNSYTLSNVDGSYTSTSYTEPLFFNKQGQFLPIDLKVTENNSSKHLDYPLLNASNCFSSYLPNQINQGFLTEFPGNNVIKDFLDTKMYIEIDGLPSSIQSIGNSFVKPAHQGAVYKDVYEAIDLSVQIMNGRRKVDYIINSVSAFNAFPLEAEFLVFEERIVLPAFWTAKLQEGGLIVFVDRSDSIIATYDMPVLIEPNAIRDQNSVSSVTIDKAVFFDLIDSEDGYIIKTKVNMNWLRSPIRTFPIIVDPDLISGTLITYFYDQSWPIQYQTKVLNSSFSIAPSGSTIDDVSIAISPYFVFSTDITYSIEMFAASGNGWSGNEITISSDNSEVLTTTLPAGFSTITREFVVSHNSVITAAWISGLNQGEVSFNILNEIGNIVYSGTFGSTIDYSVPFDSDYFIGTWSPPPPSPPVSVWYDYYEACVVQGLTVPTLYGSAGSSLSSAGTGTEGNYGYSTTIFNNQDPNQVFSMGLTTAIPDPLNRWRSSMQVALSITFTPPDCSAISVPGVSNADATGITNLTFNDINHSSSASSSLVTTGLSTALCRGGTYDLSARVNTGGNFTSLTKAWIDWNNNDVYEEASEAYILGFATNVTDGTTDAPKSITVPLSAEIATVKMRVVSAYFADGFVYPTACDNIAYGEIEDYSVVVIKNPEITSGSSIVDSSTCGIINIPISVDAIDGHGSWDTDANGIFENGTNLVLNSYTTFGVFDQDISLTWTSNSSEGVCAGSVASAIIRYNQPETGSIDAGLVANQSWLWGGLQGDDYANQSNWYQWNGTYWEKSLTEIPSSSSDVFVLSDDEAGLCVSQLNIIQADGHLASLSIGSGAELNLIGAIDITGDINNLGTLSGATNSNLRFTGSSNQNYYGQGSNLLYDLTVDNGSNSLILSDSIFVSNSLSMIGGNIINGNNVLVIGDGSANTGTLTHSSGIVTGKLRRYFPNTTDSRFFPVGTASFLRDADIDFNFGSPGIDQYLTIEYIAGKPQNDNGVLTNGLPLDISGQIIDDCSSSGYWEIVPTDGDYQSPINDISYTLDLHMNGLIDVSEVSTTRVIKSAGSNDPAQHHIIWTGLSPVSSIGSVSDFTISSISSGFSFFGTGIGANALPVALVSFSGDCVSGEVLLNWQTASEYNSAYFTVERSVDGEIWNEIAQLSSAGFSNDLIPYSFLDYPHNSLNYYRLTQVDVDGVAEVFETKIIGIDCNVSVEDLLYTYPSPSHNGGFDISYATQTEQSITLKILGTRGDLILSQQIMASKGVNILGIHQVMAPGVYFISVYDELNNYTTVKHVVK